MESTASSTPKPSFPSTGRDRRTDVILDALKLALATPGEHRLFRAGKLTGLFASRVGAAGEAATFAVQDGYLEKTRTEIKGKSEIEWVRLTPRGVEFVHSHDSPRAVLVELRETLALARNGIPMWLEQMRVEFEDFAARCDQQLQQFGQRLDSLTERVEEALRRADAAGPALSNEMSVIVPWGFDALTYLDQRRESGAMTECPLPELFAALQLHHEGLSLSLFHDGLRRLRDASSIRLLPALGVELTEPEYALLDGANMLYYAKR